MGRKRSGGISGRFVWNRWGRKAARAFSMEGIDLTFGLGRKYAIVGRSGSGKSGIIRLPTQYGPDDTGRILVNGRELSGHIDTIRG